MRLVNASTVNVRKCFYYGRSSQFKRFPTTSFWSSDIVMLAWYISVTDAGGITKELVVFFELQKVLSSVRLSSFV